MPAWPGGPCPECGEDAPVAILRCPNCRRLLNEDLTPAKIEKPEYRPLPEIASSADVVTLGVYLNCPSCDRELKLRNRFRGERVRCKHCNASFVCDPGDSGPTFTAYYCDCPHCNKRLKATPKYLNQTVACKHCEGQIRFVDQPEVESS